MQTYPYPMAFQDSGFHVHTRRIEQAIEAARCSVERLASLRAAWALRPPDDCGLEAQAEIIEELTVAMAFYRQAAIMIARARNGPIFVTSWDMQMNDIRQSLDELMVDRSAVRLKSGGLAQPDGTSADDGWFFRKRSFR